MKSLDGFTTPDRIPRRQRPEPQGASGHEGRHSGAARPGFRRLRAHPHVGTEKYLPSATNEAPQAVNERVDMQTMTAPDLPEPTEARLKKRRRFLGFGRKKDKQPRKRPPWSRKKKIIMGILLTIIVAGLAVGGFLGWKIFHATGQIFQGNVLTAVFRNQPLKQDAQGRTNILLFGTSEDDPGHGGADLTDSIMVASIDQEKHDAYLVSIPRDLWVKYGKACNSGYEGKINEVYLCGKEDGGEAVGQQDLRARVGETLGVDVQYAVHVNYQVLRNAVDALGGIDVVIESDDPRGILDRNFDWRCNYKCYLVKHPNGPAHLTGEQALFLAQARNEAGGYGLPRGNFDREANQRKIMVAAKEKAASAGFLANPLKITQLLDSLGENVRTNFDAAEIKTLVDVAKKTDSKNITSISLVDADPAVITTGASPNGLSIVRPVKGIYDFSGLQALVKIYFSGNGAILKEKAVVDVLNGTETPGLGRTQADSLAGQGISIGNVGNAPSSPSYGKVKLYDTSKGEAPATKQKLEKLLGVTAVNEPLPTGVTSTATFVVIVGQ